MTALHPFEWQDAAEAAHRLSPLPIFGGEVARDLGLAARHHVPVLITGNGRAERERLARLIHYNSARRTHAIVFVHCRGEHVTWQTRQSPADDAPSPQIRAGHLRAAFEEARHGTIVLDDLCNLSVDLQDQLSALIEANRPPLSVPAVVRPQPSARIIAGAARFLCDAMATHAFNDRLFYRLNSIHIEIRTP